MSFDKNEKLILRIAAGTILFACVAIPLAKSDSQMAPGVIGAFTMIALALGFYFFPTIIGWKKRNVMAIFVLNLTLGWTLIGWVVALIWAVTVDQEKAAL